MEKPRFLTSSSLIETEVTEKHTSKGFIKCPQTNLLCELGTVA
jgi:hypothetical protein